jgi:uracil-DNA glycosylase family 4
MRTFSELKEVVLECRLCPLAESRRKVVFGAGDENADVMLVGEAPGRHEDQQGIPFVGQAGRLLDQTLDQVGLKREEIFIANVLKCRPPDNRDPKKEEIDACRPYLDEQIEQIGPRVLVPMGNFALNLFSTKRVSISKVHGKTLTYRGMAVIPIYHPAAVLYNRSLEPVLVDDFRKIVLYLASNAEVVPDPEQMTLF